MSQKHQSCVFKKFGKQKDHDEYSFYFMSRLLTTCSNVKQLITCVHLVSVWQFGATFTTIIMFKKCDENIMVAYMLCICT